MQKNNRTKAASRRLLLGIQRKKIRKKAEQTRMEEAPRSLQMISESTRGTARQAGTTAPGTYYPSALLPLLPLVVGLDFTEGERASALFAISQQVTTARARSLRT